jgi:hypothetical protein
MARRLRLASAVLGIPVAEIERRAAAQPLTRRVERLAATLLMTPLVLVGPEAGFASALLQKHTRASPRE